MLLELSTMFKTADVVNARVAFWVEKIANMKAIRRMIHFEDLANSPKKEVAEIGKKLLLPLQTSVPKAVMPTPKVAFIGGAAKAIGTIGNAIRGPGGAMGAGALSRGLGNTNRQALGHAWQGFKNQGGTQALGQLGRTGAAVAGTGAAVGAGHRAATGGR